MGGLGIKRFAEFNNACLAKMYWSLLTHKDQLWAVVLKNKYDKIDSIILPFNAKKSTSWLWDSLCDVWSFISLGCGWRLGNGCLAKFWMDA